MIQYIDEKYPVQPASAHHNTQTFHSKEKAMDIGGILQIIISIFMAILVFLGIIGPAYN